MKPTLTLLAALLLAPLAEVHAADDPSPARKPNIIVILADDLGYADLGCQGSADVPSPNIDSIATHGVRFTDGYVTSPQCAPSRAGLLTGRYQNRFGYDSNDSNKPRSAKNPAGLGGMPVGERTMANRLKAAGYATGMIGKWHLGTESEGMRPFERGFDETFWHPVGGVLLPDPKTGLLSDMCRGPEKVREKEYSTDAFGREAAEFIGRHRDRPFFLYVAFVPPHWPMEAKPQGLEKFAHVSDLHRRTMLAMMASLDENVGLVLDKLREEKIEEHTLVFFVSDNGGATGKPRRQPDADFQYGQNTSKNDPCRGVKGQLLEGGIRVPFLAQWKGRLPAGKVYRQPVISLDILPTALAAAGVEIPPDWKLDGVNLLPYLTAEKQGAPHDALYWRFRASGDPEFYDRWAIRQGDWKLVKTHNEPLGIYNLAADIGESKNLAAAEPERVAAMKAAWDLWNKDNIEPFEPFEVAEQPPQQSKPRKKKRPLQGQVDSAGGSEPLEQQFADPPDRTRPWVWYRWQGPVTREGLEADLDAISGAGFGGFTLDFSDGQPLKEAKLGHGPEFGGEDFFDLIFYTLEGARKRGLQVSIMPQNGWASAGGSWISPQLQEHALVWAEEVVQGPGKVELKLRPPLREGAFYEDVAVLAFPVDKIPAPTRFRRNSPAVTADLEAEEAPTGYWKADPQAVVDGKSGSLISLRAPRGGRPSSVVLAFDEPFAADRLYLHPGPSYINNLSSGRFVLEVSEDGQKFRRVHEFSYDPDRDNGTGGFMVNLPARTSARVWRLQLTDMKHPFHAWLADIELLDKNEKPSVLPRIPFGDARAGGAASVPETVLTSVWTDSESTLTRSDRMVDLSDKLQPDGTLAWEVPDGYWVVARIGATVSGETTSATGQFRSPPNWEANKLSAAAAKAFLAGFFDRLVDDPRAKPYLGRTLVGMHLDSWECSHHLWSEAARRTWKERMPYDLEKWMPALLGFTVDSPELTRRFLWDYSRLIADLSGDEFMRAIRDRAHEVGLFLETEFPTRDRFKTFEYTDVPITEFSPKGDDGRAGLLKDGVQEGAKMTSSAAHLYGLPVTSSEAFLAREKTIKPDHLSPVLGRRDDGIRKFDRDPYALKSAGDKVFAQGVNHLIFHLFLHQPFMDRKPGLTTVYGTNFGRDLIWWPMAGSWVDYLTRCQFLLRQGVPQADFLFCLSEDALPHTKVKALSGPDYGFTLDSGYDFDFCTGRNVIDLCSVKDGKIVLPSGVSYELLVLGDLGGEITYPLLRKVAGLVEQGATVLAEPALRSPSLADHISGHDKKLRELAAALWGPVDGQKVKEHAYGQGRVLWGYTIPGALRHIGVVPAFTASAPSVEFAHRRVGGDDIFFLTSQSDQALTAKCRFRATGPAVEFWHPDTGRIEPATGVQTGATGTVMTIDFPPNGSLFVVFRPRASSTATPPQALTGESREITGPWQVGFASPFGETAELVFNKLISWPDHADQRVKTFSGSATYRTEFNVSRADADGVLDLGEVWNLARVTVNGKAFDPLWKPPYRVDISSALVEGKNRLEIEVRNTWVNRLIGDLKLPEAERKTWININPHQATSPLRPAGLLGPVTVTARSPAAAGLQAKRNLPRVPRVGKR